MSHDSATCMDVSVKTTIYARDSSGNIGSCVATVHVKDTTLPTVTCKNIDLYLDATGNGVITASQLDNGSSDNCGFSIQVSKTNFNCSDVGSNQVTLIATDLYGNVDSCKATVTVKDSIKPVINCTDITIQLGATGSATLSPTDVDAGSSDVCGLSSLVLSRTSFDCSDVGTQMITLTATDIHGNTSSCTSRITIEDLELPVIICPSTQEEGVENVCEFLIPDYASQVMRNDNCTDSSGLIYTQIPSAGTIVRAEGRTEVIMVTVTDSNGNKSVCSFDLKMTCDKKVKVSEGFSPNGDGINDVWVLKGIEEFPNAKLKILNRWGNLVYESQGGYKNDWDGTNKVGVSFGREELPVGTYFYILELGEQDSQGEKVFKGYVYLQR